MRTLIIFLTFLSLSVWGTRAAADIRELTLEDALRTALAHNPRLHSARQAIESAEGRAEQARAWLNPEISFTAEDVPSDGSLSDGKNLVGVSQTVLFPLKPWFKGRAGRSEVEENQANYGLFAIGLEREVKIAFFRALAAEQSLAITREVAGLAEGLADAGRKRVEAGAAPLQEELRAEIELERVRSDVYGRERERDLALENLFVLMGEPSRDVTLVGDLSADTTLVGPTSTADSVRLHPLLAGAAARRDRAENELRSAKLEPLPDFDLHFAAGRDEADDDVMEIEAAFSIPLFNWGGGLRREKRAELGAARAELAAAGRDFEASRRNAAQTFRAAARQMSAYRDRILPRAEQALELVRRGFEAGKFGFIDLLDTQRTLAEVRLAYIEKLFDLNSARAEWDALNTNASKVPLTE